MRRRPPALGANLARLARAPRCERCQRPAPACLCDVLPASKLPSPIEVLVLQHPQEDDAVLGTAKILEAALLGAELRVGLSWPSLAGALDRESVDRSRWGLLFSRGGEEASEGTSEGTSGGARAPLEGLVVLDGTWSQAKTLYWRNPWLRKLSCVELHPREPSMYGKLRKEPRREWVSTLEAVADALPELALARGEDPAASEATRAELRRLMRTMLQRVRDALAEG